MFTSSLKHTAQLKAPQLAGIEEVTSVFEILRLLPGSLTVLSTGLGISVAPTGAAVAESGKPCPAFDRQTPMLQSSSCALALPGQPRLRRERDQWPARANLLDVKLAIEAG